MREQAADELILSGRIQMETAATVLRATGINPEAHRILKSILDSHLELHRTGDQTDLSFYLQGETAEVMKHDIIRSALLVEQRHDTDEETVIAIHGLLEILEQQEP